MINHQHSLDVGLYSAYFSPHCCLLTEERMAPENEECSSPVKFSLAPQRLAPDSATNTFSCKSTSCRVKGARLKESTAQMNWTCHLELWLNSGVLVSCHATASLTSAGLHSAFQMGKPFYDSQIIPPPHPHSPPHHPFPLFPANLSHWNTLIHAHLPFSTERLCGEFKQSTSCLPERARNGGNPSHHLIVNLMNASFNVTVMYNTALIAHGREGEGARGVGMGG